VVPPVRAQRALLDQREPAASLLTVDHGADADAAPTTFAATISIFVIVFIRGVPVA
jgi:hypothetical protein